MAAPSKTVMGVAAGAVALAAAGWVGAGVWAGVQAEKALQAALQPAAAAQAWRLSQLKHDRGWLSSSGTVEVTWQPGCASAPGADEPVTLKLAYQLSHLPLPQALLRAQWQATPTGDGVDAFEALFGRGASLQGQAAVSPAGAWRTDMQLPAVALRRAGEAVEIAPSTGFLKVDGKALAFGWTMERAVMRGNGQAVEMKDLALDLDLRNRHLGTGSMDLRVGTMSAGFGQLDGLSLRSQASEQGDRLDMSFTPSVKRVQAAGRTLRDLTMELAVQGLDTRSVETLSTTFEASCGFDSLTAAEGGRARQALVTLLTRGFSMGIAKLSGQSDEGRIDGQWTLALAKAAGTEPSLAEQLTSSGQLRVSGRLVDEAQRRMAVQSGVAEADGDSLQARYDYARGVFKLNGRATDASAFQQMLAQADTQLRVALAQFGQTRQARADAPQEIVETEEDAPAEVAVAAAAPQAEPAPVPADTGCVALADCVAASLQAARAEDVDALRRHATRLEGLPKPDLGNRAVARKLNDAALAALKRDDAAEAVRQLRQAAQENPRDVEVAGNLGYALVQAGQAADAVEVLRAALVLEPRRSSTWTPLAEALALAGRPADAQAALWVAFQWSGNRDKSIAFYADRATTAPQPALQALYRNMNAWVNDGARPALLASR